MDLGTVIVTGGASGLGRAVAEAIADAGGTPVVLDRRPADERFQQAQVDLAAPRFAEDAVRFVAERHPDLRGVVTAAGIDAGGALADVDAEAWDRVVQVNLVGTAAVVRAALPALERNGGRVVTVASTLGLRALPEATAYCASKFGVVGFTRALQAELAGRVGVTLLVPGGVATRPGADANLADPSDLARAVVFALGQPAGFELREVIATPSTEPSWP
jgi:NAD(P)-dependent dehydrogenase (short-subunit alcohol dehydrogenase family)